MMRLRLGMILLMAVAFYGMAAAEPAQRAHTPQGKERKAILDALRKPVEKELKQKVQFKVQDFRATRDWAFMFGVPQQPNGKPVNYRKTSFKDAFESDAFDDSISALLHKVKGKWKLVVHVIGATDVPWVDWPKEFGAPKTIFRVL